MNRYVLNIGMDYPGGRHTKAAVEKAVRDWLPDTEFQIAYYWSDTEPTAVVWFSREAIFANSIIKLCEALNQEAIAFLVNASGRLAGPNEEVWGPFDGTKFIMPGGVRHTGRGMFRRYEERLDQHRPEEPLHSTDFSDPGKIVWDESTAIYDTSEGDAVTAKQPARSSDTVFMLKDADTHVVAKVVRQGEEAWVNLLYVPTGASILLRAEDFRRMASCVEKAL